MNLSKLLYNSLVLLYKRRDQIGINDIIVICFFHVHVWSIVIFATFDGVDGSSLRAELRPKGRGRPQRILTGSWPEEHVHGVIRAVVFRDPSSLPRHMDREDASKLTANRNNSSGSATSSSAAAAAMSRILNVNTQPPNIQVSTNNNHLVSSEISILLAVNRPSFIFNVSSTQVLVKSILSGD